MGNKNYKRLEKDVDLDMSMGILSSSKYSDKICLNRRSSCDIVTLISVDRLQQRANT